MVTRKSMLLIGGFAIVALVFLQLLRGGNVMAPGANMNTERETAQSEVLAEASCKKPDGQLWNFAEKQLQVNDQTITVAVASTAQERQRGLGFCEAIPQGAGMYFVLDTIGVPVYWMKDTLVPLDIIWIYQGQVIGLEKDIQPEPGVSDADLTRYSAPGSADAVLELPAGSAANLGIVDGVRITVR